MSHRWNFFRAGGFDQVRLTSGEDLLALDQLDQKLWVALACPTRGLEFDTKTLDLIDTDKDGRIRVPEVIAAVKWASALLKNNADLFKGGDSLPLTAINDGTAEGKQVLASARQILANLGKSDAAAISVADTSDTTKIFAATKFNGDGIVPADSADDAATTAVVNDILACLGGETDRSGKPGVTQAKVDQFFAECAGHSDWWKKTEADKAVLPLGDATPGAAALVAAIKPKVDDYFARCRLAGFDSRALNALNRQESEYLALAAKDLSITAQEIAGFPLARVEAGKPLPLKDGINPAHAEVIARLQTEVIKPLLGDKVALTADDWAAVLSRLAPYHSWAGGKAGAAVEKLGLKRVREILASKTKDAITALVAKDKALEPEATSIAAVDRLTRYHRDLALLLNNFVSFRDFYTRRERAIFQVGVLYLDQRSCELCLSVEDAGKHGSMAGLAGAYLAYCECVRKSTGEKMQIVAAFTDGDSDNLMVGRNGIFYDRKGRDWDATITKIIDNPISLRQAFWAPYKKFVRMIEEQVAKRAAAAEAASNAKLQAAASGVAEADKSKPAEAKKMDPGTVAAIGVAFGAIGTFVAAIWAQLLGIISFGPLGIIGAVIGVLLLISGPSLILAFIKLRKRNLGPILDANGWAVNANAKINVPFGAALTHVAKLPAGASRDLVDPFAEKKRPWGLWIVILLVLYAGWNWYRGKLDAYLPDKLDSTAVLGSAAPAASKSANPLEAATNAVTSVTNAPAK